MRNSSLFEDDRSWLITQLDLKGDWDRATSNLLSAIDQRIEALELIPHPVNSELQNRCRRRVWSTIRYHWQQAISTTPSETVSLRTVIDALSRGVRLGGLKKSNMRGDPLADSILVEGCCIAFAPSLKLLHALFLDEYRNHFGRNELLQEAVWDRLNPLDETKRCGWLENYAGYSSLRVYLRVVIRSRAFDVLRTHRFRLHNPLSHEPTIPESVSETELNEFRSDIVSAVRRLPLKLQRVLLYREIVGLSNHSTASKLKTSDATTSKYYRESIDLLRRDLLTQWQDSGLLEDPSIASHLHSALREFDQQYKILHRSDTQEKNMIATVDLSHHLRHLPESNCLPEQQTRVATEHHVEEAVSLARPNSILVASISEDSAESVFDKLAGMCEETRQDVVCINATSASSEVIVEWINRFDARVFEQDGTTSDFPVFVQLVFFLSSSVDLGDFGDFLPRPEIDFVVTERVLRDDSEIASAYLEHLSTVLSRILNADPAKGLTPIRSTDAVPIEEILSADQLEAWTKRVLDSDQESF